MPFISGIPNDAFLENLQHNGHLFVERREQFPFKHSTALTKGGFEAKSILGSMRYKEKVQIGGVPHRSSPNGVRQTNS